MVQNLALVTSGYTHHIGFNYPYQQVYIHPYGHKAWLD